VVRRIREQEVDCVERLREITADPFAKGDNGLEPAKAIFQRAELACKTIVSLLPPMFEKYKDQLSKLETAASKKQTGEIAYDEIVPLRPGRGLVQDEGNEEVDLLFSRLPGLSVQPGPDALCITSQAISVALSL
jgi:hypothetical protein